MQGSRNCVDFYDCFSLGRPHLVSANAGIQRHRIRSVTHQILSQSGCNHTDSLQVCLVLCTVQYTPGVELKFPDTRDDENRRR